MSPANTITVNILDKEYQVACPEDQQAELMVSANSEKVRSDAANSILTHLKPPETQKIELDIGIKKDSSIMALREATMGLVEEQRKALASGNVTAQEVAHSRVVIDNETGEAV